MKTYCLLNKEKRNKQSIDYYYANREQINARRREIRALKKAEQNAVDI
jgi:hypothetical protein